MAEIKKDSNYRVKKAFFDGDESYLHDSLWVIYNSPIWQYEITFRPLLQDQHIPNLLIGKDSPVVVDLMAPSGTLRNLAQQLDRPLGLGIALSLNDLRTGQEKDLDQRLGISQIEGDVANSITWRKLVKEMNGQGADLIIERAVGGLYHLPKDIRFTHLVIRRLWRLLKPGGTLLMETRDESYLEEMGIDINNIVQQLQQQGFTIDYFPRFGYGVVRVDRLADDPADLNLPIQHRGKL